MSDSAIRLNAIDCYVIGTLVVKKAYSKRAAISFAKSYLVSAKKLVKCGIINQYQDKYWCDKQNKGVA